MQVRDTIYVDGAWVPSAGSGVLEVVDSHSEQVIGTVPDGTASDVDAAVAAARAAFGPWSALAVDERAEWVAKIGEALSAAGVPGRGLYLKEKAAAKPTASTSARVAAKSASLSPGKPTMKSEERAISPRARRSRSITPR